MLQRHEIVRCRRARLDGATSKPPARHAIIESLAVRVPSIIAAPGTLQISIKR